MYAGLVSEIKPGFASYNFLIVSFPKPAAFLLAAGLAALAVGGAADARRAVGPGTVRVKKERRVQDGQLFWTMPMSPNQSVQMIGYIAPVADARYVLADERGFVGEVRVTKGGAAAPQPYPPCPDLFQAEAAFSGPPRRVSDGLVVAFGPTERALERIHTVMPSDVGSGLPHPRDNLILALDLDGDASADVALWAFNCKDGPGSPTRGSGGEPICVESWARDGATWRLTSSGKATCN